MLLADLDWRTPGFLTTFLPYAATHAGLRIAATPRAIRATHTPLLGSHRAYSLHTTRGALPAARPRAAGLRATHGPRFLCHTPALSARQQLRFTCTGALAHHYTAVNSTTYSSCPYRTTFKFAGSIALWFYHRASYRAQHRLRIRYWFLVSVPHLLRGLPFTPLPPSGFLPHAGAMRIILAADNTPSAPPALHHGSASLYLFYLLHAGRSLPARLRFHTHHHGSRQCCLRCLFLVCLRPHTLPALHSRGPRAATTGHTRLPTYFLLSLTLTARPACAKWIFPHTFRAYLPFTYCQRYLWFEFLD